MLPDTTGSRKSEMAADKPEVVIIGDVKAFQRDLSGYDTVFGTPDPLTLAPTPSDYVEHHKVQTGSRNYTSNRKY